MQTHFSAEGSSHPCLSLTDLAVRCPLQPSFAYGLITHALPEPYYDSLGLPMLKHQLVAVLAKKLPSFLHCQRP